MAAFDFPATPTDGQTYTPAGSSVTYTYSTASGVWKAVPVYPTLTAGRVLVGDGTSTPASLSGAPSFRNILINGDMRINQRGVTIAAAAVGAYGPDRWKKTAGGMTQIVESGNFKPSTVYTISGTGVTTAQITSPATGNWTIPDVPITATNIQLEEGTVATPFERRPIASEFAICRRYCQWVGYSFLFGAGPNHHDFTSQVNYPVAMAVVPTIGALVADPALPQENLNAASAGFFKATTYYCTAYLLGTNFNQETHCRGYRSLFVAEIV